MTLEDSSTYQMILEKGIAKGEARGVALGEARGEARAARSHIARLGAKRFGPAPKSFETKLNSVGDLPRLERMVERILDAQGWDDLLATE